MYSLNHRSVFGGEYAELTINNLVAGELAMMVARGLSPMTATGFLTEMSEALVDDVYKHIQCERLRVVVDNQDNLEPVAFLASRLVHSGFGHFGSDNLYYLGGMIVDEQHRGIGGRLLRGDLMNTRADYLGLHTQNLKMLGLGEKLSNYDYHLAKIRAVSLGTPEVNTQYVDLPGRGMYVIHAGRYGQSSLYRDLGSYYERGMSIPGVDPSTGDAVVFVGKVKK